VSFSGDKRIFICWDLKKTILQRCSGNSGGYLNFVVDVSFSWSITLREILL
jgi:hypothetical protein